MTNIKQTLAQRQTQNLLLKPKMLQSLEMLAMPLMQLETHLKQEMITNPMLELQEPRDEEDIEPNEKEKVTEQIEDDIKKEKEDDELKRTLEETKELSEILDAYNELSQGSSYRSQQTEAINFDQLLQTRENKKQLFFDQLETLNLNKTEYEFAYELIESVDDHGYLPQEFSMEALAEEYGIKMDRAEVIHQQILQLEPRGITARNIQESLISQIEKEEHNEHLILLIKENFEDLIHKRYKKIASNYGVTLSTILNWRQQISQLDPKPGLRLLSNQNNYVTPDVIIKRIGNDYEIIINDFTFPKIRMSRRYKEILKQVKNEKEAVNYVRGKINSAKFLIKSVYLRSRTLERVTKAIINNQTEFFYENNGVLKPLTYSVIAEELQVNESTISRVVRQKYADTPFGIMCLKDFFTSKAGKDEDYNSVSRHSVETKIKRMIDGENKQQPLSDQDIADELKKEGINVSRRVVAKYRKFKGILNSHLRRKE